MPSVSEGPTVRSYLKIFEILTDMTREEVKNTVNGFLVEDLEIEENKLREDALLKEDVGIDSLDFVDIVVLVEEKFGIKIKAEEMAGVKTLGAFYDYVESRLEVSGK